ncbi:MAG: SprT-like domain-containing protein [Bacteroidota bacterium]|nr:SprT-like domain-containing protein [Bacteroidota bacterium]
MTQLKRNQSILYKYIPEKAVPVISEWIYTYDFKLKIKKSRSSKYGDYRPPLKGENHQITINYDMNQYAFLITLVHEIAHLTNWNKHRDKVKPHGEEWKTHFKLLMHQFMIPEIFPPDVISALRKYMSNPAASSCSDTNLLRILKKYDERQDTVLLEELPEGATFRYNKEREFKKGEQVRKRFKCKESGTNRLYLFNPLTEVELLELPPARQQAMGFSIATPTADLSK